MNLTNKILIDFEYQMGDSVEMFSSPVEVKMLFPTSL